MDLDLDLVAGREARVKIVLAAIATVLTLILCAYVIHSGGADGATGTPAARAPSQSTGYVPPLSLAVLGDSYTAGSDMGGGGYDGWPLQVCVALNCGYDGRFAVGGTGYVQPGAARSTFLQRAKELIASRPDMVIISGGLNDQSANNAQFRAAVDATFRAIKSGLPTAVVRVFSSWSPTAPSSALIQKNADLRAAAARYGFPFVDVSRTFVGRANLIGTDRIHPTSAGHAYMVKIIKPIVRQMMRQASRQRG